MMTRGEGWRWTAALCECWVQWGMDEMRRMREGSGRFTTGWCDVCSPPKTQLHSWVKTACSAVCSLPLQSVWGRERETGLEWATYTDRSIPVFQNGYWRTHWHWSYVSHQGFDALPEMLSVFGVIRPYIGLSGGLSVFTVGWFKWVASVPSWNSQHVKVRSFYDNKGALRNI